MPVYDDHPIRLLMLRHNVTQERLAQVAGVNRSTIDKLLQGTTKTVNPAVMRALIQLTGSPSEVTRAAVTQWNERPLTQQLSRRAQATLLLSPEDLPRFYATFRDWRLEFAPTATRFASMVRVNRLTVKDYEDGKSRTRFLPRALHTAMAATFDLTDEYLLALGRLRRS